MLHLTFFAILLSLSSLGCHYCQDLLSACTYFPPFPDWQGLHLQLNTRQLTVADNCGLMLGYPIIGLYRSDYLFLKRIAFISCKPEGVLSILPQKAFDTVAPLLNYQFNNLDISAAFVAFGLPSDASHESPDKIYNLVYHPWVGSWHTKNNSMNYFHETIFLGIFGSLGIESLDDAAFESFSPQAVHWHHPNALSPNNARFKLSKNQFSSFWALAVSQDKRHLSLTYFLLAHNQSAEEYLAGNFSKLSTLQSLRTFLKQYLQTTPAFDNQDLEALHAWHSQLAIALKPSTQQRWYGELSALYSDSK